MDTVPWPENDARRPGPIGRAPPKAGDVQQESFDLGLWPVEILTNVFLYVEWGDLLRVRRVSKRLSEASKIRVLWLSCVYRHNLQCILRKRLDLYTSAELEAVFLAVQKAKGPFAHPSSHLSTRRVDHGVSNYWSRKVTGGRWLLAEPSWSENPGVLYLDLEDDLDDPSWQPLIDVPSSSGLRVRRGIDYDPDAPYLRLEITLATERLMVPGHGAQVIEVWEVTPTFNQGGMIDGLQASRVCEIPLDFYSIGSVCSHRGQISYVGNRPVDGGGRFQSVQQVVGWKGTPDGSPELRLSFDLNQVVAHGQFTMPIFDHHSISLRDGMFILCDHSKRRAQRSDKDIHQDQIVWTAPGPALDDFGSRATTWNPTYVGSKAYVPLHIRTGLYNMSIDLASPPGEATDSEITQIQPLGLPLADEVLLPGLWSSPSHWEICELIDYI